MNLALTKYRTIRTNHSPGIANNGHQYKTQPKSNQLDELWFYSDTNITTVTMPSASTPPAEANHRVGHLGDG